MARVVRPDDLRRQNRETVLRALRRAVTLSRTALCRVTGLSPATVSAITAGLLGERVLVEWRENGAPAQKRGRPQVALALNPAVASVAAISLTLNRVSAALIDYSGKLIAEEIHRFDTVKAGPEQLAGEIETTLRRVLDAHPAEARWLMEIAVGIQGVTDANGRLLLWSPITPVTDLPLAGQLERKFGVPAVLANDCNMIAEGLRWRDPERFGADFAALLLSNGIGMGLYLRDQPFNGVRSSAAEFGHMIHIPHGARCRCGKHGCIEAYAGDYAIRRRAALRSPDAPPEDDIPVEDMRALAKKARHSPGPERDAYREAGTAIGTGLGNLFALIDPVPVALVGPGAAEFSLIEETMREAIAGSMAGSKFDTIAIQCYAEEHSLIREGCMITALKNIDRHTVAPGNVANGVLRHAS